VGIPWDCRRIFLDFLKVIFFSFSPWEIHFLGNLWGICLIFEWFLQQIHVFWKKIVGLMWLKQCHLHHPPVRKAFFFGWYVETIPKWVVYGIVLTTLSEFISGFWNL